MTALPHRRLLLLAACAASATAAGAALAGAPQPMPAKDRIALPPDRRAMRSPSGRYELVLRTEDHWQTRTAIGELTDLAIPGQPRLWQLTLPQSQGPRRVLVTDQGSTVMFDSWLNVASPHAIVVVSRQGRILAVHGFDAILALLGVSRSTMAQHRRLGMWLSSEPVVSTDGSTVLLAAGGRRLRLCLADGSLTTAD